MDAAAPGEAIGLLTEDGSPWCYAANATVLKCSTLADRTVRSGIYELEVHNPTPLPCCLRVLADSACHCSVHSLFRQEWKRLDRPYCTNDIFRSLVLDNVSMTEAECRLAVDERLRTCQVETCPQCISPCNYPWAKAIADVFKCVNSQTHYGFVHYYMVSDAGQLARSMHGARRSENFIPVRTCLALSFSLRAP